MGQQRRVAASSSKGSGRLRQEVRAGRAGQTMQPGHAQPAGGDGAEVVTLDSRAEMRRRSYLRNQANNQAKARERYHANKARVHLRKNPPKVSKLLVAATPTPSPPPPAPTAHGSPGAQHPEAPQAAPAPIPLLLPDGVNIGDPSSKAYIDWVRLRPADKRYIYVYGAHAYLDAKAEKAAFTGVSVADVELCSDDEGHLTANDDLPRARQEWLYQLASKQADAALDASIQEELAALAEQNAVGSSAGGAGLAAGDMSDDGRSDGAGDDGDDQVEEDSGEMMYNAEEPRKLALPGSSRSTYRYATARTPGVSLDTLQRQRDAESQRGFDDWYFSSGLHRFGGSRKQRK